VLFWLRTMSESTWTSTRRSAAVTCAAALAILGSATALMVWGSFFLGLLNSEADVRGRKIYESHPIATFLVATVPFFLIASGFRTGIGLFQLKPSPWFSQLSRSASGGSSCFAWRA
jgi:hypothetical protein